MDKTKHLDQIAEFYNENDFDYILLYYALKIFESVKYGSEFLEMGCSIGLSTKYLLRYAKSMDVVEGSTKNIERTRRRINRDRRVKFYNALWEDFEYPEYKYSDIIWFRGIEHIKDPLPVLINIKKALKLGGRIHITFPNALSLHRRLGVYMGIIKSPWEFSERDIKLGHYDIYDRFKVASLLKDAGYKILSFHGIILKPLPNNKMMELYKENPKLIEALFEIGKELPDYCAEIYICATPEEVEDENKSKS